MAQCFSCGGSGKVGCSSCGGKRTHYRLTINNDMDSTPCFTCGATGRMRCMACGGSGRIGADPAPVSPASRPRSRGAGEDVLEGRWNGNGGTYYEFAREGGRYRVTEGGPLGKTGEGTASLEDGVVRIQARNMLLGNYALELQLSGGTLRGAIKVLGLPVPFVLARG